MVEIVDVKEPEITPELALTAARVIRDFCKKRVHCEGCVIKNVMCVDTVKGHCLPDEWDIPEREV